MPEPVCRVLGCKASAVGFTVFERGPGPLEVFIGRPQRARQMPLCATHLKAASETPEVLRRVLMPQMYAR